MKRIMCIWLPGWPVQRRRLTGPDPEGHDFQADVEALGKLALWSQQFSPVVALEEADRPESLLLDVSGCSHLFGGEEGLARQAVDVFREKRLRVKVALADTVGAAWAVARCTPRSHDVVPPARQAETLQPLPVEALRLVSPTIRLLHQFDIRRVGQLMALPRASLPSRFGREVLRRLDQALGNVAELVHPEQAAEPIEASWTFDSPVADGRVIEAVLEQLLQQILERLRPRQWGVQQLSCRLKTSGEALHVQVGLLRASDCAKHLLELLHLQLQRVVRRRKVMAEVSEISLCATLAVPLEFRQGKLFDGDGVSGRSADRLPPLIERLSHRLGEKTILRCRLWPDAQPEFACRYEPWLRRQAACSLFPPAGPTPARALSRPPCLLRQPLPIQVAEEEGRPRRWQWQGQQHVVAQCWGPERIETGWWRERDVRRDYYQVETTAGRRFWIFRTTESPLWFLHGIFG